MKRQFYLETFGCQMNVVDSERIVDLLQEMGYCQVDAPDTADLILLNTCSVRAKAERKVYGHLGRFKPLKDQRPELILGVGGCVAQQEGERMLAQVPYLDLVFGTHNIHMLPQLVLDAERRRVRGAATEFLDRETRLQLFPPRRGGEGVTRFVTVMQGCDNFCSYCIVPHVRGREVSRPRSEILDEIRGLAAAGVREVTLLGQNVNSYALKETGEPGFARLLGEVQQIDGIERIRFTTSHPKDLSQELIECFGTLDKLCHHLHLPVQSGSDRILAAMNRGYSAAGYLDKVTRLKEVCPDIRLTTDIIVGFPGENQDDFERTLALVEEVGYADAFTFLYSARPGTAAADMHETASARSRGPAPRRSGRRMSARALTCWWKGRAARGRGSCSGAPPGTVSSISTARPYSSGVSSPSPLPETIATPSSGSAILPVSISESTSFYLVLRLASGGGFI